MVLRTFSAADNEALTITSDSPHGTAGNPIINNSNTPNGTIFEFTGGFEDHRITLDDTSSNPDVFHDGNPSNHTIVDGKGIVADGTGVESESKIYVRALDDDGNPTGPTITLTVFSKDGTTSDVWGFATDTSLTDGVKYVKTGGNNNGNSEYTEFDDVDGVPCFAAGTLIATPSGERPVEMLAPGDLVMTADQGAQPVLWIGRTEVMLEGRPNGRPVLIQTGALGGGLPRRDLVVSPQHRIVVNNGGTECFVAAKALTSLPGVRRMLGKRSVGYIHVLLKPHAVLFSEGMATESFFPGPMALAALSREHGAEIRDGFMDAGSFTETCRPVLRVKAAQFWLDGIKSEGQDEIAVGRQAAEQAARRA